MLVCVGVAVGMFCSCIVHDYERQTKTKIQKKGGEIFAIFYNADVPNLWSICGVNEWASGAFCINN